MPTLKEILKNNEGKGIAVGHFNVGELSGLKAIADAARELNLPVIIGTSEGEREFMGAKTAVALVKNLRVQYGMQIFLNADHTHSFEKVQEAAEAGYDAILFDGGKLPWEENLKETKRVVDYVRSVNPNIVVEAELGYIGSSSEVRSEIPEGAAINAHDLTTAEQAKEFVTFTGIDMLAPAVGNIHGMFANAPDPALDIARIKAIKEVVGIPLVLHGASGNTEADVRAAIAAGVSIVHISTELRVAWRKGLEKGLQAAPNEVAPHKLLGEAVNEVKALTMQKLKLFQG